MPAVKDVGEPCAGESHARFEVAAGGNRNQSGYHSRTETGASRRPYSASFAVRTRMLECAIRSTASSKRSVSLRVRWVSRPAR